MKPCPHKHVEARIWSRHFKDWRPWKPGGSFVADALVCRDCNAWLAVGESEETASALEIRAAEIAADHASNLPPMPAPQCPIADEFVCVTCQTYDLARCIATHEGES